MPTKEFETHKRAALREKLARCTIHQIAFFNRIYVSVYEIPEHKIDVAIGQVERTIKKNEIADNRKD